MNKLLCKNCGFEYPLNIITWKCDCGGLFKFQSGQSFHKDKIVTDDLSLWRYRHVIPLEEGYHPITMGEGMTPLVPLDNSQATPLVKLDYLCPTGSFKDRGSTVLISIAKSYKVKELVEDSSGNAGASIAAYSSRAEIKSHIFVPASTKQEKINRIKGFGADITKVEGPREKATEEALKKTEATYYASHWANPLYFQGTKTFAFEVWEQLNYRAPEAVIMPVGHGTNILGAYIGFKELKEAGLIERMPKLIAIQSEACSPISSEFAGQKFKPSPKIKPIAEGIAVATPPRKEEILTAIEETEGFACIVNDDEIYAAGKQLAAQGFFVELTSAVALAGYNKLSKKELSRITTVVISLTGRN